jgi:hypothetical protein
MEHAMVDEKDIAQHTVEAIAYYEKMLPRIDDPVLYGSIERVISALKGSQTVWPFEPEGPFKRPSGKRNGSS